MTQDKTININSIQVLRGIASLLVLLFHLTVYSNQYFKFSFLNNFFNFGKYGVDVFFVLSGFIISYTSIREFCNLKKIFPFIIRRIIRIFPTYWIVISLLFLMQLLFPSFYNVHTLFSGEFILSAYLLFPSYTMYNAVYWTLSYELFYYGLFTMCFILPQKNMIALFFIIYTIVLFLIPLSGHSFENLNTWKMIITSPLNVEFFAGVLCSVIVLKMPLKLAIPLIVSGGLLFLTSGICSNNGLTTIFSNSFDRVLFFGFPSTLIILGMVKYEMNVKIKIPRILILLGESSYTLYLFHLPIITVFIKLILHFNILSQNYLYIFYICIILFCCLFCYHFYRLLIRKLNSLTKTSHFF